jgi:transposase InsO family protein
VCDQIVQLALAEPEKSARQLAWQFTEQEGYFVSESSVFRLLKRFDLVESSAFELVTAADRFAQPTRRVNELWQTDFTYFKIQGWGWYYLSTILDDYSRYILAWKLTPTMAATDVHRRQAVRFDRHRFPGSSMPGFGESLPVDKRWDAVIVIRTSALEA